MREWQGIEEAEDERGMERGVAMDGKRGGEEVAEQAVAPGRALEAAVSEEGSIWGSGAG